MFKQGVGFFIDELDSLNPSKDTSIALMQQVQAMQGIVYVAQLHDIIVEQDICYGLMTKLKLHDNNQWYEIVSQHKIQLDQLDHIWLRKDPPFDSNYLYATLLLDLVVKRGGIVYNAPAAIRSFNEKLFIQNFSCMPDTLVASNEQAILDFIAKHNKVVLKSLDSYGGRGVISLTHGDPKCLQLVNKHTNNGTCPVMLQQYLDEIAIGDKRVLMINGEPYPYALLRIPKANDFRGNLDAGASYRAVKLTAQDHKICAELSLVLKTNNIMFAGIDIIGDYCTEINITSPTCMVQLAKLTNTNIAELVLRGTIR